MSSTPFYASIIPDCRDPEQATTVRPGLCLEVVEQDGGIGIGLSPINAATSVPSEMRMGIMNVAEAEAVIAALQQAVSLVKQKLEDQARDV